MTVVFSKGGDTTISYFPCSSCNVMSALLHWEVAPVPSPWTWTDLCHCHKQEKPRHVTSKAGFHHGLLGNSQCEILCPGHEVIEAVLPRDLCSGNWGSSSRASNLRPWPCSPRWPQPIETAGESCPADSLSNFWPTETSKCLLMSYVYTSGVMCYTAIYN